MRRRSRSLPCRAGSTGSACVPRGETRRRATSSLSAEFAALILTVLAACVIETVPSRAEIPAWEREAAREAMRRAAEASADPTTPDSVVGAALVAAVFRYGRILIEEAHRLSRLERERAAARGTRADQRTLLERGILPGPPKGAAPPGSNQGGGVALPAPPRSVGASPFVSTWNEGMDGILQVLRTRPVRWRGGPARSISILCDPETFSGETFALPSRYLMSRMAAIPESIAACCLDDAECVREAGASCVLLTMARLAARPEIDALVGYRSNRAYWRLPPDVPPRGEAQDRRVAASTVRAAADLLKMSRIMDQGGASGPIGERAALGLLSEANPDLPEGLDPFVTVPGLRNPRRSREGGLICDVVLPRIAFERAEDHVRSWFASRVTGGSRSLLVDGEEAR